MDLKEFRKNLGLTQREFGEWLSKKGLFGNDGNPYSQRTIESWEQSARNIPRKLEIVIEKDLNKSSGRNIYFAKKFTQALSKWKQENGYTQDDLSKITGIHKNSITRYKKGEAYPTPETMDVICSVFGVSEDYFLPHDEVKIEYRQKALSDYTTDELLAEIKRRIEAS